MGEVTGELIAGESLLLISSVLIDTRELSQGDAASCATQEATNLDGTAFFGPLCLTSAFANERCSSAVYCRVHVMHERIPSPGKVSDWLILQLRRTARTTLISAITVLDSRGRMVSSNCRNLHTTRTI